MDGKAKTQQHSHQVLDTSLFAILDLNRNQTWNLQKALIVSLKSTMQLTLPIYNYSIESIFAFALQFEFKKVSKLSDNVTYRSAVNWLLGITLMFTDPLLVDETEAPLLILLDIQLWHCLIDHDLAACLVSLPVNYMFILHLQSKINAHMTQVLILTIIFMKIIGKSLLFPPVST